MILSTFEQALRSLCEAKPFVTFVIELMNGKFIMIKNPSDVTSFNGLFALRREHFFDCHSVCRLYVLPKSEPGFDSPSPDLELDLGPGPELPSGAELDLGLDIPY